MVLRPVKLQVWVPAALAGAPAAANVPVKLIVWKAAVVVRPGEIVPWPTTTPPPVDAPAGPAPIIATAATAETARASLVRATSMVPPQNRGSAHRGARPRGAGRANRAAGEGGPESLPVSKPRQGR